MLFLRRIYRSEEKKKKRSLLTMAADAFAAVVIGAAMLFLIYDSLYMLRRYLPRIIRKVKHRVMIDPEATEALQEGRTLDLGKALRGQDEEDR